MFMEHIYHLRRLLFILFSLSIVLSSTVKERIITPPDVKHPTVKQLRNCRLQTQQSDRGEVLEQQSQK